jgi:hypothetical protein
MGYTTRFEGSFRLDRSLAPEHADYLRKFAETRRMKRNPKRAAELPDPVRNRTGLSIGRDACYFVGGTGLLGQDEDGSVLDYDQPPAEQPGLWCSWTVGEDQSSIAWNGMEKFYEYIRWLDYLILHFLAPWGYTLNGEVRWGGEDEQDRGVIRVRANVVAAVPDC